MPTEAPKKARTTPRTHLAASLEAQNFLVREALFTKFVTLLERPDATAELLAPLLAQIPHGALDLISFRDQPGLPHHETPFTSLVDWVAREAPDWALPAVAQTLDPNGRPAGFSPAIFAALRRDKTDAIIAMLDTGRVDVERPAIDGLTPLAYAAAMDNAAIVQKLLAVGADPLATMSIVGYRPKGAVGPDITGLTALMISTRMGSAQTTRILAAVSDVEAADSFGRDLTAHAGESSSEIAEIVKARQILVREVRELGAAAPAPSLSPTRARRSL